jgi:hypothetical protein
VRHQVEDALGENRVVRQSLRAVDRLGDVWDHPSAPASVLVAEDPQRSSQAAADGALGDDAAQGPVSVRDRRHLDHELSLRHSDFKPRVVEVTGRSLLQPRRQRLEDPPVQPHGMTAGS